MVIADEPTACVALPGADGVALVCSQCFKPSLRMLACTECARVRYCSAGCRSQHAATHKVECGAPLFANVTPAMLLALRALRGAPCASESEEGVDDVGSAAAPAGAGDTDHVPRAVAGTVVERLRVLRRVQVQGDVWDSETILRSAGVPEGVAFSCVAMALGCAGKEGRTIYRLVSASDASTRAVLCACASGRRKHTAQIELWLPVGDECNGVYGCVWLCVSVCVSVWREGWFVPAVHVLTLRVDSRSHQQCTGTGVPGGNVVARCETFAGTAVHADTQCMWAHLLTSVLFFVAQICVPHACSDLIDALTTACGFIFEGRLSQSATWYTGTTVGGASTPDQDEVILAKVLPSCPSEQADAAPSAGTVASDDGCKPEQVLLDGAALTNDAAPSETAGAGEVWSALNTVACEDLENHVQDMHPFDYLNVYAQAAAVTKLMACINDEATATDDADPLPTCAELALLMCALRTNCHAITAIVPDAAWEAASDGDRAAPHRRLHVNAIGGVTKRIASAGVVEVVQQRRVGVALYLRASMVNHSCEPNCIVRFDGRFVHCVAGACQWHPHLTMLVPILQGYQCRAHSVGCKT